MVEENKEDDINFDYATLSKLRNQILLGLITFGIFFPVAWYICGWMVSLRFGGELLSRELKNNILLQGFTNNQSIETIEQNMKTNKFGLNPMIGLVSPDVSSGLWWVSVLTVTFFFVYFSMSSNLMVQSGKTCGIPSLLVSGGQAFYNLIPLIFPLISYLVDYLKKVTNETFYNPNKSNFFTFWGQKSMIVMVVSLILIVLVNFFSLWGTCAVSIWVLGFALFFILLLGLMIYLAGDVMTLVLRKISFLMGVEVHENHEFDSFFMRYSWIWFVGLPIYFIASAALPVFMVQNTSSLCQV